MDEIKISKVINQPLAKRGMAETMTAVWQSVPTFVQMANARADNLIKVKKELEEQEITYNDILIKCMINAVKKAPEVNSTLDGDKWIIYEDINVSVAVITEYGLFVPVIRNAGEKNINEISADVKAIVEKAKTGSLTLEDMSGGTITISNLGATGVETGTPILNPPQAALAFIGNIRKVPVVDENDTIKAGYEIGYSVGYDHRFIDGMTGQVFTTALKTEIENVSQDSLY